MAWEQKPGPRPKLRDTKVVLDSFGLDQIKPCMHGPEEFGGSRHGSFFFLTLLPFSSCCFVLSSFLFFCTFYISYCVQLQGEMTTRTSCWYQPSGWWTYEGKDKRAGNKQRDEKGAYKRWACKKTGSGERWLRLGVQSCGARQNTPLWSPSHIVRWSLNREAPTSTNSCGPRAVRISRCSKVFTKSFAKLSPVPASLCAPSVFVFPKKNNPNGSPLSSFKISQTSFNTLGANDSLFFWSRNEDPPFYIEASCFRQHADQIMPTSKETTKGACSLFEAFSPHGFDVDARELNASHLNIYASSSSRPYRSII